MVYSIVTSINEDKEAIYGSVLSEPSGKTNNVKKQKQILTRKAEQSTW